MININVEQCKTIKLLNLQIRFTFLAIVLLPQVPILKGLSH